jgi:pyridoxal phosphate enzyme (YggS family)
MDAGSGPQRLGEDAVVTISPDDDRERRAELAANLARVRTRIASACHVAGRDPGEVTLVAVTKTFPVSDIVLLTELGVRDIGENRDQEAAPKAAEVAASGVDVRWHFVGRLQRNKCRSVVRYADVVQSVDSVRLARVLADAAQRHRDRGLDVLVQVSLDNDSDRGGALRGSGAAAVLPDRSLDRVVETVAAHRELRLAGLMAIAPLHRPAEQAFALLAEVAADLRADHPDATVISAGMSADLEPAIAYGATHVRIGSALLGNRAPMG